MPAKLLFRDAQGRDGAVELRGEPVYVGRAVECAVRTDDGMVSRKHSMIRFDQGRYWVEDLGSSNGTHVNDVKVQKQALNHNDVVRCGSLWLRYVEDGPLIPAQPAAQPANLGFMSTMATSVPMQGAANAMQSPTPASVVVSNMGGGGGPQFSNEEVQLLRKASDEARQQYEDMRADRDKEVAENKRLRAETSNLQQRLEDFKTQIKEGEEVIHAHKQLAEEIKQELDQVKEEHASMTAKLSQTQEDLASRTRQLQRANEDVTKAKADVDIQKKQVAELSKIKDDGFKKLNDQLAEVEHLREVIREQERILEERRVGLIGLEEGLKDLRRDKEERIKEVASMRSERDELRLGASKRDAKLQATDEENRRLSRLLADLQSGGSGGDSAEVMRLGKENTSLQVEAKRLEAERRALAEKLDKAEERADTLKGELKRLEAEGEAGASDAKSAEREKQKADEARSKAEAERTAAIRARDEATKEADELRKEVEQLRRKVAEAASAGDVKRDGAANKKLEEAMSNITELNGVIEEMNSKVKTANEKAAAAQAEIAGVKTKADAAIAAANEKAAAAAASASSKPAAPALPADAVAIKEKAGEVFQGVNDVLNELRMNVSLVRDEFLVLAAKDSSDRARSIKEAIEAAAGQTEDMKGVLRGLRELAEG